MIGLDGHLKRLGELHVGHALNIGIIGAGAAGLSAAWALSKKRNITVTMLEASARVGGRLFTHRFAVDPQRYYFEMGGSRYSDTHDYTRHFVQLSGLDHNVAPHVMFAQNAAALVHARGVSARLSDFWSIAKRYNLSPEESRKLPHVLLSSIIEKEVQAIAPAELAAFRDFNVTDSPAISRLDHLSLRSLLAHHLSSDEAISYVVTGTGTGGMLSVSALWLVRLYVMGTTNFMRELRGGIDQLPERLGTIVESSGVEIRKHAEVIELHNESEQVRVELANGGHLRFDYVICTAPLPVMRRMQLTGVTEQLAEACSSLPYTDAMKIGVLFKERFWEKRGIFAGASFTDGIFRKLYYPSNTPSEVVPNQVGGIFCMADESIAMTCKDPQLTGGPGMIYSYFYGVDAAHNSHLPDEQLLRIFLRDWQKLFPEMGDPEQILDYKVVSWSRNQHVSGGMCLPQAGLFGKYFSALTTLHQRLILAGEHASPFPGWMQGAFWSGLNAAEQVLRDGARNSPSIR